MAYSNWDIYNVLELYVVNALKLDTQLGTAGTTYKIADWAEEIAEAAINLRDDQLPRIAVEVNTLLSEDESTIGGNTVHLYAGIVEIICAGGDKADRLSFAKAITARVERCLMQQYQPGKQLAAVTAQIEGAVTNSVQVGLAGTNIDAEQFGAGEGVLRAVAAVGFTIELELAIPED